MTDPSHFTDAKWAENLWRMRVRDLENQVEALKQRVADRAIQQARIQALEEAALAIESMQVRGNDREGIIAWLLIRDTCAAKVRALKDQKEKGK